VKGLPKKINLVTIDASFISLKVLLPVVKGWFHPPAAPGEPGKGDVVALVKPQFEAGRGEVARGEGVIRDPAVHRRVVQDISTFALAQGYGMRGLLRSPLRGPKGNAEFLAWMDYPAQQTNDLEEMLDKLFS
jgi:23S rRNA (cytidine1920-2'-O)/16S rRNA (cytidine1409-2'-O)-methyltransferase